MITSSLTLKDKEILESLKPVVDGIAALWGENCEVVLHSLESLECSVIHIANGHITGRIRGSPITDLGMKILQGSSAASGAFTGAYFSKTADGKLLRSISVLIRNKAQKPIGMLCVNFNMSVPLADLLCAFSASGGQAPPETAENFVTSPDDLIKMSLRDTINTINGRSQIPNHEKNKNIVYELLQKGIFDIRGAIDLVAQELSVSRYTIYNYIREYKFSLKAELS